MRWHRESLPDERARPAGRLLRADGDPSLFQRGEISLGRPGILTVMPDREDEDLVSTTKATAPLRLDDEVTTRRLQEMLRLVEAVAADQVLMQRLSAEERARLIRSAGEIYAPDAAVRRSETRTSPAHSPCPSDGASRGAAHDATSAGPCNRPGPRRPGGASRSASWDGCPARDIALHGVGSIRSVLA